MRDKEPRSVLGLVVLVALLGVAVLLRDGVRGPELAPSVVEDVLQRELDVRVGAVLQWRLGRTDAIESLADDPSLRAGVSDAVAGRGAPLDALLGGLCGEFAGCMLVTPEGRVVASYVGRDAPPGLVRRATRGRTVHSSLVWTDALGALEPEPGDARVAVFFATPIVEASVVQAVLVARVKPDRELDAILSADQVGRTGETYAVDARGFMLTRSRFHTRAPQSDEALRVLGERALRVETPAHEPTRALAALRESGTDVQGYADYRGVRVVGAWRWLDELNAGIVTEMDLSEAYARR